jgi:hypothetical protein
MYIEKMPLLQGNPVFTLTRFDYISQNHFLIPIKIYVTFFKLNTIILEDSKFLLCDTMPTGKLLLVLSLVPPASESEQFLDFIDYKMEALSFSKILAPVNQLA